MVVMNSFSLFLFLCPFQYGFLDYDTGDGKKLFFHMSEVINGDVHTGDDVEFVLITNQRTSRQSAVNVRKVTWVEPFLHF